MNLNGLFAKKGKKHSVAPRTKEERAQLLLKEYARVFKLFREHPAISIIEVKGVPPESYRISYRVDGLSQSGKSIESKTDHIVEIILSEGYPDEPPSVVMQQPAFHPNISASEIDIKDIWIEAPTLADCIVGIGRMIVYQRYNLDRPLNGEAAQWAMRNKNLLPLSQAELGYHELEPTSTPSVENATEQSGRRTSRIVDEGKTRVISEGDETESITVDIPVSKPPQTTHPLTAAPACASGALPRQTAVEPKRPPQPAQHVTPSASEPKPVKSAQPVTQSVPEQRPPMPIQPAAGLTGVNVDGRKTTSIRRTLTGESFCPMCGAQNVAPVNFCTHCGIKLTARPSRRMAKLVYIIGMIAIPIIILEMGVIILLLNKKSPEAKTIAAIAARVLGAPPASQAQEPQQPPQTSGDRNQPQPAVAAAPEVAQQSLPADKPMEKTVSQPPAIAPAPVAEPAVAPDVKPNKKKAKKQQVSDEDAATLFAQPAANSGNNQPSKVSVADNLKLGRLYLGIGSADDAIQRFRDVLAVDPANMEAKEGLEKAKKMKLR